MWGLRLKQIWPSCVRSRRGYERSSAGGDAGLGIDLLDAIETLKSVGCAAQAVITDGVATSIRADRKAAGLPRVEWDRGVASQIALARRESPNRGGRHLGFALALVHEMPHTLALLRSGRLNEWRAVVGAGNGVPVGHGSGDRGPPVVLGSSHSRRSR